MCVVVLELRRDPGVPDLSNLHRSLERRAASMDSDAKFARQQAYAKRRVEEQERKEARRKGGDTGPTTSATGGKLQREVGTGDASNDARDVAARRHYWSEMVKVVDASDIILEVLDARDPEGCRCREVETMIQSKMDRSGATPKRIILVLNKIDLVPHENLLAWIKHNRREFPTIAFKSNTQQQSTNLKQTTHITKGAEVDEKTLSRSAAVGSQALLQLLKNYSRSLNIKKQITVGIIGYPNVGKSSLINSLTRARRAAVGNMPGLTKSLQMIKLDHQISLIDSPGVMFSAGRTASGEEDTNMLLRNCLRFEQIQDPIAVVYKIVERCTMDQLKTTYDLTLDFEDADQFIFQVAQKRGKLGRGGVPDCEAASKIIIKDWNDGKIEYFSDPPEVSAHDTDRGTDIVSSWSNEFDIDALLSEPVVEVDEADMGMIDQDPTSFEYKVGSHEVITEDPVDVEPIETKSIVTRPKQQSMQQIEMEGNQQYEETTFVVPTRPVTASNVNNPQTNQSFQQEVKKEKRKQRKDANRAAAAAAGEDMEMGDDGAYQDDQQME